LGQALKPLSIELYGKSGMRVLDMHKTIERNKLHIFGVETTDLGPQQCISIGHDNSGFGASWFFDKIVITSQNSQEQWFFLCGD